MLDTNNSSILPFPTLTLSLLFPSPKVSRRPAPLPFDQLGHNRPTNDVDIGAYQYSGVLTFGISGNIAIGTNVLGGIGVSANGAATGLNTAATTTNGSYQFTGLQADTYTVTANPVGLFTPTNGVVTVGVGNPSATVDFAATSEGASLIQGVEACSIRTKPCSLLQVLSNRTYRVQETTNVSTNNSNWVTISTNTSPSNNLPFLVLLTNSNAPPRMFFRTVTP